MPNKRCSCFYLLIAAAYVLCSSASLHGMDKIDKEVNKETNYKIKHVEELKKFIDLVVGTNPVINPKKDPLKDQYTKLTCDCLIKMLDEETFFIFDTADKCDEENIKFNIQTNIINPLAIATFVKIAKEIGFDSKKRREHSKDYEEVFNDYRKEIRNNAKKKYLNCIKHDSIISEFKKIEAFFEKFYKAPVAKNK